MFARKHFKKYILKLLCLEELLAHKQKNKNKNEENYRLKQMYSIIKTNKIEKITEATKNGLEHLELDKK